MSKQRTGAHLRKMIHRSKHVIKSRRTNIHKEKRDKTRTKYDKARKYAYYNSETMFF